MARCARHAVHGSTARASASEKPVGEFYAMEESEADATAQAILRPDAKVQEEARSKKG